MGSSQTLLDIEIGGRLVKHVAIAVLAMEMDHVGNLHIGLLDTDQTNGKTLKLTTGEKINITVRNLSQL